jgi:hypothetical protein
MFTPTPLVVVMMMGRAGVRNRGRRRPACSAAVMAPLKAMVTPVRPWRSMTRAPLVLCVGNVGFTGADKRT